MKRNTQPLERHQLTNADGKVLVLRVVGEDYKTYGGFKNPENVGEFVEAPDWNDNKECGGGIHGWALGIIGDGKEKDFAAIWQVYEVDPADGIVRLGTKCKFRKGKLIYSGAWFGALKQTLAVRRNYWSCFVEKHKNKSSHSRIAATSGYSSSAATSGDYSSAATSGYSSSAATSGHYSSAATSGISSSAATSGGYSNAATSGDNSSAATSGNSSSAATSGDYSSAATSGGHSSAATSGDASAAVVSGLDGRVMAGNNGCIALAWRDKTTGIRKMRCAETGYGAGQLKPHTWYKLDAETGAFVECEGAK